MGDTTTFEAPGPGTWALDPAHFPAPLTPLFLALYIDGAVTGFGEAFDSYAFPVAMRMAPVNGWVYACFGRPETDPSEMMADLARRDERAREVLEGRLWRGVLSRWDEEIKPAAIKTHLRLGSVDRASLDDGDLAAHLAACFEHARAMSYQHHRFNTSAMFPIGDFCAQVAGWTGEPVESILSVFEGCSPMSGVWSDEIARAARAVSANSEARALVTGEGDPGERLAALRAQLPDVDEWATLAGCRIIEGFDLLAPTASEVPTLLLGKLAAAVSQGGPKPAARADVAVVGLRSLVPEEHRAAFDDLYADARDMYRLRDERGLYSDIPSTGITRLAVLELGHRLSTRGIVDIPDHLFDATPEEVLRLAGGATSPSADELRARAKARTEAEAAGAPPVLGDPAGPPPPPLGDFAPSLGRLITGMMFLSAEMGGPPVDPAASDGLIAGLAANGGTYTGRARVVRSFADLHMIEPGDVLVAVTTTEACNAAIHLVGAIVTDHGGRASHPAIVAREMGIPAVVNTKVATSEIPDGATITVDGTAGTVTLRQ